MIKQQIATLLEKEVDRKDFLKHVGVAVVAMVGLSSILSNLSSLDGSRKTSGYGKSSYGR